MPDETPTRRGRYCEVRERGFSDRASVEQAIGWIDAHAGALNTEEISVAEGAGRVLDHPAKAKLDLPPFDCAAIDGYALRSRDTIGAGDYNPLSFDIQNANDPLLPSHAALVGSGMAMPAGADAVLSFDGARVNGSALEVFRAVAQGVGVERRGQQISAGTALTAAGVIQPRHVGLFVSIGMERVKVVRSPRVRIVIAGPKPSSNGRPIPDADGPMLCALVRRDGGAVESVIGGADHSELIRRAVAGPGADAVLVVGRTDTGPDDDSPVVIAEVGELTIYGVALRPGGSIGMGLVAGIPVLLLPGHPLACFCAYELFAGRLIRGMSGRSPALPYAVREVEVRRKIVSSVGFMDFCQVRIVDGGAEPIGSVEFGGLASAVRADGFVLIPAPLEGYAPGARVAVHLY